MKNRFFSSTLALLVGLCATAAGAETLQELIDATPAGGVCEVPPGSYAKAVVDASKTGITIRGTSGSDVSSDSGEFAITVEAKNVTIADLRFVNCWGGVKGDRSLSSNLVVSNCVFYNCKQAHYGAGIYYAEAAVDCFFYDCHASQYGGGCSTVNEIRNCDFYDCSCPNMGGAVYYPKKISGTSFYKCGAKSGGAVFTAALSTLEIDDCVFNECVATNQGGAVYTNSNGDAKIFNCEFSNCSARLGGAVYCADKIENCTFTDCKTVGSSSAGGGAICDAKHVTNSKFTRCKSEGGNGGACKGYVSSDVCYGTFTGCTFKDCGANNSAALYEIKEVHDSTFNDCISTNNGAIFTVQNVVGCTFENCRSISGYGGGVNSATGITNCTFNACSAGKSGGGVSNGGIIEDCSFIDCEAHEYGGGVNMATSLKNSRFSNCTAGYSGGAASQIDQVRTVVFSKCSATSGGAVWQSKVLTSLFCKNSADDQGGACGECSEVKNCTFAYNTAGGDGSGLYASASDEGCKPMNCLFLGCTYNVGGDTDLDTSTYCTYKVGSTSFVDASGGDFHITYSDDGSSLKGRDADKSTFLDAGELDLDGMQLVSTGVSGKTYFFAGCYTSMDRDDRDVSEVTSLHDSVDGPTAQVSLRDVVEGMAANPDYYRGSDGNYTVKFADSLFDSAGKATLEISAAGIDLAAYTNGALVVASPEGRQITITGGDLFRAFRVRQQNKLVLKNITFQNGFGSRYGQSPAPGYGGGAVQNCGELEATDCTFSNCHAGNGHDSTSYDPNGMGGAIYNTATGKATVKNCTFSGNLGALGGAFANQGTATITGSTFSGNVARGTCGGRNGLGGAIFSTTDDIEISGTTFRDNSAANASNDVYGATLVVAGDTVAYAPLKSIVASIAADGPPATALAITPSANAASPAAALKEIDAALTDALAAEGADWFTVETAGGAVRVLLNALATPTITEDAGFEVAADGETVALMPGNVKPNLFYGLGAAATPAGPFAVADGAWVQADAAGVLSAPLTAPKVGDGGFYKVVVRE